MALSLPGLDNDVVAKIKSGDLGALEKLFRAAYPALLAKAKEVLGDDTAAARVVERLVPRLFAERAGLSSLADLSVSLEGVVHEAAVRERSRLAGIRKRDDGGKASGPAPSVDDVWAKIASVIQGPTKEQLAAAEEMKDRLRHEAAGHIKQMTKKRPWYVAAGVGVALISVVGLSIFFFSKSGEKGRLARQISAADVSELKTGTGQRGNITLNDGTAAKAGADTRLRVPAKFGETVRGIGIEGAAEFAVVADPKPFQVLAKNVLITAKGTVFAVSAYPTSNAVIVRVKEGAVSVEVQEPAKSQHELTAGQSMIISADGKTGTPNDQQMAEALGYLDDKFYLGRKTLKEALAEVKRWYATDLFLKDTTLGSRVLDSVSAPLGSSSDAIKALEAASGLVFGWEGQTMVLRVKEK